MTKYNILLSLGIVNTLIINASVSPNSAQSSPTQTTPIFSVPHSDPHSRQVSHARQSSLVFNSPNISKFDSFLGTAAAFVQPATLPPQGQTTRHIRRQSSSIIIHSPTTSITHSPITSRVASLHIATYTSSPPLEQINISALGSPHHRQTPQSPRQAQPRQNTIGTQTALAPTTQTGEIVCCLTTMLLALAGLAGITTGVPASAGMSPATVYPIG